VRRRRLPPVAGGWLRIRWPEGGRAGVRALGSRGRRACGVDLAAAIGNTDTPRGGARRRRWRSCDRGCRLRVADSSFVFGRDMLDRCGFELRTDAREHCLARTVVIVEHPHLDELVRKQVDVDLVQYAGGKPVMAHAHDRTQPVRLGAKIAALSRGQGKHCSSVAGGSASQISRLAYYFARLSPRRVVADFSGNRGAFSSGR
jgi:hypothetical protein